LLPWLQGLDTTISGVSAVTEVTGDLSFADFQKVDIRVGTIIDAQPYPEARRPAYKLWVDLGAEIGQRKSSAQVTENYRIEDLIGRQVAAVVNFPPKQIGRFMSEILVLGFPDEKGEVVLIQPSKQIPNGARLY
jgi:tRNA-binding protein